MIANFEFDLDFTGQYADIPPHMQEALRRYVVQGIPPGHFLTAVIRNDLRNAVGYADAVNLPLLKIYVQWFYNIAPSGCFGSPEIMKEWMLSRQKTEATTT